jgi:outer membrane protein TolC
MLPAKPHFLLPLCLALTTAGLVSCTPGMARKSADREVFRILRGKSSKVPNAGTGLLDITPPPPVSLEDLAQNTKKAEFLGDRAHIEKDAKVVPLAKALELAVTHNREYLSRKELLHLQALDLSLVRHEFTPIFTGTGAGEAVGVQTPVTQTVQVPNPEYAKAQAAAAKVAKDAAAASITRTTAPAAVPATPAVPQFLERRITTLVSENTFVATGNLGVSVLTRTGARIAADFTTDFLRLMTGGATGVSDSTLAFTLTQPLLRGAGYRATMETLTQAERDLMYAIRDFTQYRKSFTVDIASRYYRTLEARDAAKNAHFAYKAFETILGSERELAKEDRRTSSQLGLIEQASLKYKRLWISSVRSYEQQLDDLKIALGVPVEQPLLLDEKELSRLTLEDPPHSLEESVQAGLVARLDLYNARDSVADTERKIKVAAQDLLPQLDLQGRYLINSDPGLEKVNLNRDRRTLAGGLNLDLRLDKKGDRNAYRSATISQQRAVRELDLAEENVRAALRADWRDLDTARKQYEIAGTGVALSQRRVEEEQLLMQLGRGTARDLIDAQQDLSEAQDDLTSAIISHTINRLELYKDMGVLHIQKDGAWVRVLNNEAGLQADE